MINASDVKSGISAKLKEQFPGIKVYKETMTNPAYPHFFIDQINANMQRQGKLFLISYLMGIQYRHAKDPTKIGDINEQLEVVGLGLVDCLETIISSERKIYSTNATYEKVDGVLQYQCNFVIKATKEQIEENKMETVKTEISQERI